MKARPYLLVLGAALAFAIAGVAPAVASTNGVVISEFQFRGVDGSDEFVELLNTTTGSISIAGWRLQGCAADSGAPSARATVPAGVTLGPGQRYLFANSNGSVAGDASYTTGIATQRVARGSRFETDGGDSRGRGRQLERRGRPVPRGRREPRSRPRTAAMLSSARAGARRIRTTTLPTSTVRRSVTRRASERRPPGEREIREIQGRAHVSPLDTKLVKDVEGVVTARRTAGGRGSGFRIRHRTRALRPRRACSSSRTQRRPSLSATSSGWPGVCRSFVRPTRTT